MNTPAKTKRNTLILTSAILVLSWAVMYQFLEYKLKESINEQFQRVAKSTEALFEINMKNDKIEFEYKLDDIVASEGLAKAIANRDYAQINSIVSPQYKRLKLAKKAVNILTFRSVDGVTLFRAHKPEYFGDTLNEKRTLITDTNTLHRSFGGFEVGKFEMTYRITKPIFYNQEYVGNVELGISPTEFLKDLNSIFKAEMGIIIDKSLLEIMMDKSTTAIDERYILINNAQNIKKYFLQNDKNSSKLYRVDMNISLENHLSQKLGYLVVGLDISDIVKKDEEFIYTLFFMVVIMMFASGAVLHQGFNKMLNYFSRQVYTDHLTGLLNRHSLNDALYSKDTKLLILSNIKEFSLINELYGVDVGNEVLIQVADAFRHFGDEHGFDTYRVSSDEYVLLKKESNFDEKKYFKLVEELQSKINSLKILIVGMDDVLGIEIYSGMALDHEHSLEDAQMALKKAKKQFVNYMIYSQHVDTKEHSQKVISVKRTIRHALEHKNVIPFFQPITDREGKIVKYEALVRIVEFDGGEKKILYPNEFLEISMNSGLYIKIAKEMLELSLDFFAKREEKVSVNFLPNDFFNASIMETLINKIEKFDSPQRIVVEVTEQEGVENFERLMKVVKKLRAIAIDDFGSGYANYVQVLEIKPDYLKIDGSLIQNILTDENSKILVKSIVRFAQELNIITVAEYVENEDIFNLLKEYGVEEFQGYYFGRPMDLIGTQAEIK
ncbi:MAG: diguanylate cyclase [Sulfurimonas sp. RIFOXYD12_FULL_33_39]|uniref:EAL domain-containing protein n=1 Tax=unclassified Sulfurimonas TaxID=2623549 RepID=UPI0008CA196E|nr:MULTISPECIES: EAL domain-containing protein [unclassified Sulfurimonas]OHE02276.1 MAG: diguanylate cyclase [Sulfurimonas sp. RIFCSPLOWO2_12_FULL_34_6]OHE10085.1 MAG: diguanylate cyclase [Sulfurimonas sp. RIFOXYD12_FULL_33_39]OHE14694.1 MAG: diguanylate cyclase [Sulfurimonas sp. RIFOXYD2_FULL_34_21]DAB28783.1 MAG TPA: GGDEF domain-containing protein [Sulfurimonas sp. UBA10385]